MLFPQLIEARCAPNSRSLKLLNFQKGNNRTQNIEVEGVETVENVDDTVFSQLLSGYPGAAPAVGAPLPASGQPIDSSLKLSSTTSPRC
jgi:hypothetical protein